MHTQFYAIAIEICLSICLCAPLLQQHLNHDVCLEVRELFCVVLSTEVVQHKHTKMSSSYSSLYWVLFVTLCPFHCASIRLCLSLYFVCCFRTAYLLYYCECGGVDMMRLKPNP